MRNIRTETLLGVVALMVYAAGITWGAPYATDAARVRSWATDAITPLGPLSELHNTLVEAKPDRFVAYPLMHYFLLAALYAPYLLALLAAGGLSHPAPQYPFGFADPVGALQTLELIGRLVSVCMAAGIVVAAYRTGRLLWDHGAGLIAAVFVMLLYPMWYYSRTGNLDVPVLFWTSLGILVYAEVLQCGLTTRRAARLGAFAALATATKDQGWGAFGLLPPVLLAWQIQAARRAHRSLAWRPLVVGLISASIVYAVASGLAVNPERYLAHVAFLRADIGKRDVVAEALSLTTVRPPTLTGYAALTSDLLQSLATATSPPMLVVAAVGILLMLREPRTLAMLVPALGHVLLVIVPTRIAQMRYVMPIALVLCLPAARALALGLQSSRPVKMCSAAALVAICSWQALLGVDLTYQMWHDSRYAAARWLQNEVRAGDRVGHTIPASYLPRLSGAVRYELIANGASAAREIDERRPQWIIIMPDWTSAEGLGHPAAFPDDVYRRLADGSLGYRLAAHFKSGSLLNRQLLDYPTVNPPVDIYERRDRYAQTAP